MKKQDRLFEAIGEVDEKYVDEAAKIPEKKPKNRHIAVTSAMAAMAAAAAIFCLTKGLADKDMVEQPEIGATAGVTENVDNTENNVEENTEAATAAKAEEPTSAPTVDSGGLPKISAEIGAEGMGFEGLMTNNVSELLDGNPWSEEWGLTELPVFSEKNFVTITNSEGFDGDAYVQDAMNYMELRMDEIGGILGGEVQIIERVDALEMAKEEYERLCEQYPDPAEINPRALPGLERFSGRLKARIGNATVEIFEKNRVEISFTNADDVPPEYRPNNDDTYEKAVETAEYLGAKYAEILGYDSPAAKVWRDLNIYGEGHADCTVYERSDDPLTCLLNYNFRTTQFYMSGGLHIRSYNTLETLDTVGVYPIITEKQAFERLLSGDYMTTVWTEQYLPDGVNEDEVVLDGLCYRRTADYSHYLPYYRYLVELHSEEEWLPEGAKLYGGFYVPAVAPKYLESETPRFN